MKTVSYPMLEGFLRSANPQVFLGARTAILRDRNARSSAKHTVKNTGFGVGERRRRHAEHFVVEAEEPSMGGSDSGSSSGGGMIRCGRSCGISGETFLTG